MAKLQTQNGEMIRDLAQIKKHLEPLKIELSHWPIDKTEAVKTLLDSQFLNESEKENLLASLDSRFFEQKKLYGYQARDLVVLSADTPKLNDMLSIFDKTHRHSDDEVRYIVDGSGIFGFILPNQEQMLLTVEAEEFIRVPRGTEHWFLLDEKKRIKAVRYFTNKEGWVAEYSGTKLKIQPESMFRQ